MRTYKERIKKRYWILGCLAVVVIALSAYAYTKTSGYVLRQYTRYLNHKEYDKMYDLFYKDNFPLGFEESYITSYIEKYFTQNNFVKVQIQDEVSSSREEKNVHYYELQYRFQNKSVKNNLKIIKYGEFWKVVFPFNIETVKVNAPLGSKVYMNDTLTAVYKENAYIFENVLPDTYRIMIKYPNNAYNDYMTTIDVPEMVQVISPYKTVSVIIKAPKGTEVELASEKKLNTTGVVSFSNMIEGNYTLKITSPDNWIKPYSKQIVIDREDKVFEIKDILLSDIGKIKLNEFINNFYTTYINGIKQQNSDFMKRYINEKIYMENKTMFEKWFIEKKKILDANMKVNLEESGFTKEGDLQLKILEIVELINYEKKDQQEFKKINYKVILKTNNTIDITNKDWEIRNRQIQESIVSYKDTHGNWVEY